MEMYHFLLSKLDLFHVSFSRLSIFYIFSISTILFSTFTNFLLHTRCLSPLRNSNNRNSNVARPVFYIYMKFSIGYVYVREKPRRQDSVFPGKASNSWHRITLWSYWILWSEPLSWDFEMGISIDSLEAVISLKIAWPNKPSLIQQQELVILKKL